MFHDVMVFPMVFPLESIEKKIYNPLEINGGVPAAGSSRQCLTASLAACARASRWSSALELGRWMRDGRLQMDHLAMNGAWDF